MPEKKNGRPKYRRILEQKTTLIPSKSPGNPVVPPHNAVEPPSLDGVIIPGNGPVGQRMLHQVRQTSFNGPLPHPEIFRGYGDVIEDAPERILTVFEQDSAHIRSMQQGALDAQREESKRVQWMAFCLIAMGYIFAFVFAMMDKNALASVVLGTTMVATLVGFLQNRETGSKPPEKESTSSKSQSDNEKPKLEE